MNCTHCGSTVRPNAAFCASCGQSVASNNACLQCGEAMDADAAFCMACGAAAAQGPARATAILPAVPQPEMSAGYVRHEPRYPTMQDDSGGSLPAAAVIAWLLAAVAILVVAISSLVTASKTDSFPSKFQQWTFLLPPPNSTGAYKAELVALIVVAALASLAFLLRSGLSRLLGPVLGFGVIGIVVGNALSLSTNHQFLALLFSNRYSTATWI